MIYVWNKCDKPADSLAPVIWDGGGLVNKRDVICVSALTGQGIDALVKRIEELVLQGRRSVRYLIPNEKAGELSRMYELATVTNVEYGENGITVDTVSDARARGVFARYSLDKDAAGDEDGEED